MSQRKLELTVDEQFARRLAARAIDLCVDLDQMLLLQLTGWLGDWGLRYHAHVVQAGETLSRIALRYYQDSTKVKMLAAFNKLADPGRLEVGQTILLPEVTVQQPLPPGESPYIYGLHDRGGEFYMGWAGRKGWVLCTEELGADPGAWGSQSYRDLSGEGYGVLVRLNNGYGESGTLPRSDRYEDFARRCGNFVERSSGCHIWIIGNEMNLAVERPGGPEHGEWITPAMYARAFRACRSEIRLRAGHGDDQVVTGAVGPWNIQTPYEGNPGGDWIVYMADMLAALEGELDGIAIHTYARDPDPGNIVSELTMDPPYDQRRKMFRTYMDFVEAIPGNLHHLPVYLTETNQNAPWEDVNNGWVRSAYAEIDRWNSNPLHQKIRCMLLYRWEKHDPWHIRGKAGVIEDLRDALQRDYRWRE